MATIYSFAVDDAYKNQGIGGNLLKESINELTENNVWNILLFVNINNHSALHLYEKYGFKVIGEVENICGKGCKCYKMELSLNGKLEYFR